MKKNEEIIPAIVVIGYNRIDSISRCLNSINKAIYEYNNIPLIISIDHGEDKKNDEVIKYCEEFIWSHGEKTIRTFDQNQGLKNHFLQCADYSIKYGAAIILEDDVVVSNSFYSYTVHAIKQYIHNDDILAISLYGQLWDGYANGPYQPLIRSGDVYISQIECSWGECYIGSSWEKFREWYKKHNHKLAVRKDVPSCVYKWDRSYSKYIIHYIVENNKWFITPYISLSTNFGDLGTHVTITNSTYQVAMVWDKTKFEFPSIMDMPKYNIFFQPIDLEVYFSEKYGGPVVADYYGIRTDYEGYKYCISSKNLPYKIIESYGLILRPWELNCYKGIPGSDIFVYKLDETKRNRKTSLQKFKQMQYQLYDLSSKEACAYIANKQISKIFERILKFFEKKKE